MGLSNRKYLSLIIAATIVFIFASCKHNMIKPDRAFYYWRSGFNLSERDKNYLKDAGVTKLYLHFFDVKWEESLNKVIPVDRINFETVPPDSFQYVPVVFIANKALEKTSNDSIQWLYTHIADEVEHIAQVNKVAYNELQFDCDWTDGTRNKYFKLLSLFHYEFKKSGKLLSATIRLHQVKYSVQTGVPPIDRGMLMFYNMGEINAVKGYNSIYSSRDADKYASYVSSYTLPLDVALPVFSWAVCIREGKVTGIIEKAVNQDFSTDSLFLSPGNNIFVSRRAFFLHGKYFMKNDTVKMEQVTPDICEAAANNVSKYLKNKKRTVSLFDYDSLYLSTYDKKDLEKIYTLSN